MKVLVTGSTGQVGCRLVRQLLAAGHEVRGTAWAKDPAQDRLAGLEVDLRAGELTDPDFVRDAVQGMDAVVHTANLVGPYFENNVLTTLELTRACGAAADRLDRFVYVSSSGVFPNDSHVLACAYHPVDELHPKRATSEYNLSKLVGEELTELAARRTGLRTVVVRPSHVLSGDRILQQFTVGRVVGVLKSGQELPGSELHQADGTELWHRVLADAEDESQPCSVRDLDGRPWYYQPNDARDVAHAIVCALRRPEALGETFNLGAPEPFLFPAGAALLGELTGRPVLDVRLPARWRYDHAIGKARGWLGFRPRGDLATMMRAAWAFARGDHDGYDWPSP
jgi:nucleoside-diphosphate-sugar epimerase